ncbi:MAG TPA: ELWxxDGT repeat protein, partial [Planctomycetota bacterium]|nr:ELWxxDGT repeat protein [Planctomycetota bacterium]
FAASDGRLGRELWKSDGTAGGTVLVDDIQPGAGTSSPQNLIVVGQTIFFSAFNETTGRELWKITVADISIAAPVITSATTLSVTTGASVNYTITASNSPTSFNATGLPAGLSIDTATGVISGVLNQTGNFEVILSASNAGGTGTATLTISSTPSSGGGDGGGGSGSATNTDSDGDGFPNELETALSTDPNNAASTPFGGSPAGAIQVLTVTKMSIKLNFVKLASDSISLDGKLPVPASFPVLNQQVTVDVGGVVKRFTLDDKGKGKSLTGTDSFKITVKATKGVIAAQESKFQVKFNKGDFDTLLTDEGLSNSDLVDRPKTVPVIILFNSRLYRVDQPLLYSAKLGKFGRTKQPR